MNNYADSIVDFLKKAIDYAYQGKTDLAKEVYGFADWMYTNLPLTGSQFTELDTLLIDTRDYIRYINGKILLNEIGNWLTFNSWQALYEREDEEYE